MAERPVSADIKLIHFDKDQVLVEYKDHSRLYDVDPDDKKGHVDYYQLGTRPGEQREIVLLKGAPKSLAERLRGNKAIPVRPERASEVEESEAIAHFTRGREFGRQVVKGFEKVIGRWDGSPELTLHRPGALALRYKDGSGRDRLATLFIATRFDKKGQPQYRITQVRLDADGVMIVVDRPKIPTVQQNKLRKAYRLLLKAYVDSRQRGRPKRPPPDID